MLARDTSRTLTPMRLSAAEGPAGVGRECRLRGTAHGAPPKCCFEEVSRRLEQIERSGRGIGEKLLQRPGEDGASLLYGPATLQQRPHFIQRGYLFCVEFQLLHQPVQ